MNKTMNLQSISTFAGKYCDLSQYFHFLSLVGQWWDMEPVMQAKPSLAPTDHPCSGLWWRSWPSLFLNTGLPCHHISVLVNTPWHNGHFLAASPKIRTLTLSQRGVMGLLVITRLGSWHHDLPSWNHQPVRGNVLLLDGLYNQPALSLGLLPAPQTPSNENRYRRTYISSDSWVFFWTYQSFFES